MPDTPTDPVRREASASERRGDAYRALASPTRREILRLLSRGDLVAGDVARHVEGSRSGVSRHLRVLDEAGLIDSVQREGNRVYSLRRKPLDFVAAELIGLSSGHSRGRDRQSAHACSREILDAHARDRKVHPGGETKSR